MQHWKETKSLTLHGYSHNTMDFMVFKVTYYIICKSLDSIKIALWHFYIIFVISKQAKTPHRDVALAPDKVFSPKTEA